MLKNFENVVSTSRDYLDLSIDSLQKLLQNDHLQVKNEFFVFESIMKWIQHDGNRSNFLDRLIREVRIGLLSQDSFSQIKVR